MTVRAKNKMIQGLPRRGDLDLNTPVNAITLFEPNTEKGRADFLLEVINKKKRERDVLYRRLGYPNKTNIKRWKTKIFQHPLCDTLDMYFRLGDEIHVHIKERSHIINKIKETNKNKEKGFKRIFKEVTKEMVSDRMFKRIISETKSRVAVENM